MIYSTIKYIFKLCQHHLNRVFCNFVYYPITYIIYYNTLINMMDNFKEKLLETVRFDTARIAIVTNNVMLKMIIFSYCFFTQTKLIMISPKFTPAQILNALLSNGEIDLLITDVSIINEIKEIELDENIKASELFFPNILYSHTLMEELYNKIKPEREKSGYKLLRDLMKFRLSKAKNHEQYVTVLSPGTMNKPMLVNINLYTLAQTAFRIKTFFNFNQNTRVAVIADFEFYFPLLTILGFMTGMQYVYVSENIEHIAILKKTFNENKYKIDNLLIDSNQFKEIWDFVITKVFMRKIYFKLSKYNLTKFITNFRIRKELKSIFGTIKKVHILNEDLGILPLSHMAKSKIMFSSSYGFLEQGNFLAFKDPILFNNNKYFNKPGGSLFKSSEFLGDEPNILCNNIRLATNNLLLEPGDIGELIGNIKQQGDRKYLFVKGRIDRNIEDFDNTVEMIEKIIKDDIFIRDCIIIRNESSYAFTIEIREELLNNYPITVDEFHKQMMETFKKITSKVNINTIYMNICTFDGLRNIQGKVKYYTM